MKALSTIIYRKSLKRFRNKNNPKLESKPLTQLDYEKEGRGVQKFLYRVFLQVFTIFICKDDREHVDSLKSYCTKCGDSFIMI